MSNDFNRGSFTRVQEIHAMLHPKPSDLLNPSRFFVREGDLFMWNKKKSKKSNRHFFLFNDIMLLCKKQGSKRFFLRIHITLRSPYVTTESIETTSYASEFRLHCKTRSFILYAASDEDRKAWLHDIQNSISGTHPEETKGGDKTFAEFEEKKERTRKASLQMQSSPMMTNTSAAGGAASRSQSTTAVPSKKSSSNRESKVMTNPGSQTDRGPQAQTSTQAPKKKRAKDDSSVRPKSMMETQQLQNDPSLFVYNSPTVTNNPFLDMQTNQNGYAQNSNPFATNNAFHSSPNARPQSMMLPQTQSFGNEANYGRPQSMVMTSSPSMAYNPNPFATTTPVSNPNPFATNTNTTPNPFATNTNTSAPNPFATNNVVVNPFLTNIPQQQTQPQQNPFATTGGY